MSNIDELLAIAQSEKVKKTKELSSNVRLFVKEMNIETGSVKIPNSLIFYTYRKVWENEERNKVKKITFFQNLSKLFKNYRVGKQRYYLLNSSSFDLSLKEKAEEYDRQCWSKKTKLQKKLSVFA